MKKNESKKSKKKNPVEKVERKKTNWKLVGELMHGYRHYIIFATISVLLSTAFSYAVPYVTSFTLDYVIQGISTSTPKFLLPLVESLGGRDYFVHSLFLCGIALFFFTAMNCLFTFTRRQNIAYASEGMATASTAIWKMCHMTTTSTQAREILCSVVHPMWTPSAGLCTCN